MAAHPRRRHPHKGHAISEAQRAKLSQALKGRPASAAQKANLAKGRTKGRTMSTAQKEALAKGRLGRPMSSATRAKLSRALKGHPHPHRGHPGSHHRRRR